MCLGHTSASGAHWQPAQRTGFTLGLPVRGIDLLLTGLAWDRSEATLLAIRMIERRKVVGTLKSSSAVARLPTEIWTQVYTALVNRLVNEVWQEDIIKGWPELLQRKDGQPPANSETLDSLFEHDYFIDDWFNGWSEELWSKAIGVRARLERM